MAQEYPVSPAQSTASFLPGTRFHIHGGSPRSGAPHHPLLLGNDFPDPHAWAMRLGSRRATRATAARGWFSKASPGNGNCPFPTICGKERADDGTQRAACTDGPGSQSSTGSCFQEYTAAQMPGPVSCSAQPPVSIPRQIRCSRENPISSSFQLFHSIIRGRK